MQELRANTQIILAVGPFVAVGDGFTPVTGVSLSTTDEAQLIKHNTTAGISISGNTFAVLNSDAVDGYMNLTATTTDTNTEGLLLVVIQDDSLILPFKAEYMVLSEAAYDSKYLSKDVGFMDVNIRTIGRADAQETEADNLEGALGIANVIGVETGSIATGVWDALQATHAIADTMGAMATELAAVATPAQVNAEVLDVMNVDTFAEPGKGPPGENITIFAKIGFLYKAWRNRSTMTSSVYDLYNNDAVTVDHDAAVSEAAGKAERSEMTDGP